MFCQRFEDTKAFVFLVVDIQLFTAHVFRPVFPLSSYSCVCVSVCVCVCERERDLHITSTEALIWRTVFHVMV